MPLSDRSDPDHRVPPLLAHRYFSKWVVADERSVDRARAVEVSLPHAGVDERLVFGNGYAISWCDGSHPCGELPQIVIFDVATEIRMIPEHAVRAGEPREANPI
jgi:hypothetical protein